MQLHFLTVLNIDLFIQKCCKIETIVSRLFNFMSEWEEVEKQNNKSFIYLKW